MLFGMGPEQFDVLGILAFLYVVVFAALFVYRRDILPKWSGVILLVIGLAGLAVDVAIVVRSF